MILHLILNSLVVFLALALLVEVFLFAFRIDQPRFRYVCRLFPILKIPFDLLTFGLYGESLFINFNPFSCQTSLYEFIINLLPTHLILDLQPSEHLIIPQYIAMCFPPFLLNFLTIGVIGITATLITVKVFKFLSFRRSLNQVLIRAHPCSKQIANSSLRQQLDKVHAFILVSDEINIPLAAQERYILFPQNLLIDLSQEEFEAIIAHELEHLRWKDPILKVFNTIIFALFWWIPSNWWIQRMEWEQELACDAEIRKYGIDSYDLASALVKAVKKAKYIKCKLAPICLLNSNNRNHTDRLRKLLDNDCSTNKAPTLPHYALGFGLCFLAFLSFWMC